MKFKALSLAVALLSVSLCFAGNPPQSGTVISHTSVDCGTKKTGKKTSASLLCQQYVVRTATTEYQIRQPKPAEQSIIPPNTPIQFTLDKDKMKFKANGKKYEFLIVGTSALSATDRPAN